MAILVCRHNQLFDPQIHQALFNYFGPMEIVKELPSGIAIRVNNDEVPEGDYLIDVNIMRLEKIQYFVTSFSVGEMYTP